MTVRIAEVEAERIVAHPPSAPDLAAVVEIQRRFETGLESALRSMLPRHFDSPVAGPLQDDLMEFVTRPGKRVRPLLYLLSRRIFDPSLAGRDFDEGDYAVAVGLELMHAFILVHDDIIDRSDSRRGEASLHRLIERRLPKLADRERMGRNLAIVLGDVLFGLAQGSILSSRLERRCEIALRLLGYVIDTGIGEASDIIHGLQDLSKVSACDIERMYLLKTSRYTVECPMVLAAVASGCGPDLQQALGEVAGPAGFAFQVDNDLKAFQRFEVSDTEIPEDILDGKKTAVVRKAFDLLDETDRSFLQLCFNGFAPTDATVTKIRELIVKSGAVGAMRAEAEARFQQSLDIVHARIPDPATRDGVVRLVNLIHSLCNGGITFHS